MKPTFVLFPGAWHRKESFAPLAQRLEAAGYPVHAAQLLSVGGNCTFAEDTQYIRNQVILPLIDNGNDIILVLHSLAGIPGGVAMKGLGKKDRPGKAGIVGIVYLASFIPQKGLSALDMGGGKPLDWWEVDEKTQTMTVPDPTTWFYPDVPEPLRTESIKLLTFQSVTAIQDPVLSTGYDDSAYDGRRLYFHTTEDTVVPYVAQKMMVEASGVDWKAVVLKSAHSPFLSVPDEVVAELMEWIDSWKQS